MTSAAPLTRKRWNARVRRPHHDLELDAEALALVLQLLSRVRELEGEIHSLQARLPQHLL